MTRQESKRGSCGGRGGEGGCGYEVGRGAPPSAVAPEPLSLPSDPEAKTQTREQMRWAGLRPRKVGGGLRKVKMMHCYYFLVKHNFWR